MTFTHLKSTINFNYAMNGAILQSLDHFVTDLGVVLCPTHSPNVHIERVRYRLLKILGFFLSE